MSMESNALVPTVRQLPAELDASDWDYAEMIRRIRGVDKDLFVVGVAQATEEMFEALFEWRNVPDVLEEAYLKAWPIQSQDMSLIDNYRETLEGGSRSVGGFVSNLKGKVAEIQTEPALEERFPGYDFSLAAKSNEPGYDLHGTSPDGPDIAVEVKAQGADQVDTVAADMLANPVPYAVSTDIWLALAERHPELLERVVYVTGPVEELTEFTKDGLDTLAGNMGLDIPDSVGEALPFVAEVVLTVRLLVNMRSTEKKLADDVDRGDINRVHGIRALALLSKYGVNQFMMAGGAGWGALAGSLAPGPGTAVGTVVGGAAGLGYGIWLNRQIEPYIEQLAIRLVGGDADYMFYLMNKPAIDNLGESFTTTSAAP